MKVGEYCRTKYGISKIISNPNTNKFNIDIFKKDGITLRCIKQKDIIKSSPNIIDLIEKSDLVVDNYENIYVVDNVFDNYIYTTTKQGNIIKTLCDYQIKSIITHEQIENMEYKVKE